MLSLEGPMPTALQLAGNGAYKDWVLLSTFAINEGKLGVDQILFIEISAEISATERTR